MIKGFHYIGAGHEGFGQYEYILLWMENVFQYQRLFYKLEYNLHVILNSKPEGQYFAVNWVSSVIVSVERKSWNSSFSIRLCFGIFLKSIWVGKRDGFTIFLNVLLVLAVNSNSICFCYLSKNIYPQNVWCKELNFFVGNQLFRLTNFIPFSIRSDFPRGKENVETFSLFVSYPLKQPNATHLLTFFC